jgi:membrane protein YqaA with SNARE-associated domain
MVAPPAPGAAVEHLRDILRSTARWLVADFGLAGLYVVAFLDSSFLSVPEINDVLVVTMSLHEPRHFWVYALVAALGSVSGCLVLHAIGKKGGQALLRSRLRPDRVARLQAAFRRFDLFAVLVPSLLPPPCPFKIFVLSSGAFGMSYGRFVTAVALGRTLRYLVEGYLAVRFGARALDYLGEYARELALAAVASLLAVWLLRRLAARARPLGDAERQA